MDDDDIKATALKALKRHPKTLFKPASRGASAHVTFLDRWVIRKFLVLLCHSADGFNRAAFCFR
jgi:hypothetical protein